MSRKYRTRNASGQELASPRQWQEIMSRTVQHFPQEIGLSQAEWISSHLTEFGEMLGALFVDPQGLSRTEWLKSIPTFRFPEDLQNRLIADGWRTLTVDPAMAIDLNHPLFDSGWKEYRSWAVLYDQEIPFAYQVAWFPSDPVITGTDSLAGTPKGAELSIRYEESLHKKYGEGFRTFVPGLAIAYALVRSINESKSIPTIDVRLRAYVGSPTAQQPLVMSNYWFPDKQDKEEQIRQTSIYLYSEGRGFGFMKVITCLPEGR